MKDFIASEKFLIGSNGQVGGVAPNAVNDIIKWDGTKWIAGVNPGGNGGGSAVAEPFTTSLNSGSTTYSVVFPEPFDIAPSIATDLEITGDGPIIPYTISNLTTNGYDVIFAKEIPNNNYKIHTVFGGTGGGDSTLSGESLQEIDRQITANAVDIFVYNTQQDSDGGAWRNRTSHTSWYNEELNTATRGGRREFPAVAVIVAEADKVTIYDGDDPDLPMWMVFETTEIVTANAIIKSSGYNISTVGILNGLLVCGVNWNGGFEINFVSDKCHRRNPHVYAFGGNIASRNGGMNFVDINTTDVIVNTIINDVAMTVLPNAPIDSETGLPIPTIAVATDGGVSVIRDDGRVVDLYRSSGNEYCYTIAFDSNNSLFVSWGVATSKYRHVSYWPSIPNSNDTELTDNYYAAIKNRGGSFAGDGGLGNVKISNHARAFASTDNFEKLTLLDHNYSDTLKSQFCDITSRYNTGWMPGDIKLATLSDTKNETVGVDETTELVTNNEFATDSDWTKEAGWSISGGTAVASNTTGTIYQIIDGLTIGQTYKISINVLTVTSGSVSYRAASTSQGGALDIHSFATEIGIREIVFKADTTNMLIGVYGSGFSGTIDSASLKQTGELVTNGTFDNGIEGWTLGAGWSVSGGVATHTGTSFTTIAPTTSTGLVNGKKYTYTIDTTGTGSVFFYYNGDSNYHTLNGGGSFTGTFTAGGYPNIKIGTSGDGYTVDNVSLRLAEEDRSVNDNGLQIFGEITKSPVAPGADLVAYSGFSANNYLMQPYNSDLDFGTNDWAYMGWFKTTQTNLQVFYFYGQYTTAWVGGAQHRARLISGNMNFAVTNDNWVSLDSITSSNTYNDGMWHHYVALRRGDRIELYADGVSVGSFTLSNAIGSLSNTEATVRYGLRQDGMMPFDGSLALARISATAPTAEQIARIYRDEKVLFQDGAQATLYGTSDAVTALAYDDSENLLHVGTASGRSVFNGLKRVDNTDVAVTTAIIAKKGFVIAQ